MKNIFKTKNESGMSLVSVIATMAVLGGAALGVLEFVKMNEKGSQSVKNKSEAISLTSMVETRVKSMFLNNKADDGKLSTGICSLVDVMSLDSQLSNVLIKIPSESSQILSDEIWNKQFSDFERYSDCKLENGHGRCYRLKDEGLASLGITDATLRNLNPEFEINIKTMYTNPFTAEMFKEIKTASTRSYDIKTIGFQYQIRSRFQRTGETDQKLGSENITGFIWAGDVGVCEFQDKKISLTANTYGDPTSSVVFNLAGFPRKPGTTIATAPLSITMVSSQIRSGEAVGAGNAIASVISDNPSTGPAYSACNETRYQCPQINAGQRRYEKMRHMLRVAHLVPNKFQVMGSFIEYSPRLQFKNLSSAPINAQYDQKIQMNGTDYTKNADGWYETKISDEIVPLTASAESQLIAEVFDTNNSDESNNVCRNICVPQSNFNSNANNHVTSNFTYKVKVEGVNPEDANFEVASGPVACTACFMKNCDQLGLATFGPMHDQPTEPLDAGIPECFQHEEHVRSVYESNIMELGAPNSCVAAKMRQNDQSGFDYAASSCEDQKPVMCFAYGKHMIARTTTASGPTMGQAKFAESADTCFSLGREILNTTAVNALFTQQGNLSDPTITKFLAGAPQSLNYINLSAQGSFFAPVGLNQESRLREHAQKVGETSNMLSNYFWVNLKTDSAGYVYAPAPRIGSLARQADNKYGLHFDGSGNLTVKETDRTLASESGDSGKTEGDLDKKVGIIYHNHRYKGVDFVRSWKPLSSAASLRVLCRRNSHPFEVFVSNATTDRFVLSSDICKSEGGLFIAPTTTAGWEKSLHLVNANSPLHSFPVSDASFSNPVWVNVVEDNGRDVMSFGEFLTGGAKKYASKDGKEFNADGGKDPMHACFNKSRGEVVIRSNGCAGGERLFTEGEVGAIADESNMVLRSLLFIAFEKKPSYQDSKVRLY